MRKSLWIIPVLLLFGAVVAPSVRADSVTFTCTAHCPAAVLAPTALNVTFPSPALVISFDNQTLDLTLPSEDLDTDTYTWFTSNNLFIISDTNQAFDLGADVADDSGGNNPGDAVVEDMYGNLSFNNTTPPVSTPEPGTVTLMLVGIGLVLVVRKRIGLCHSQGT
jgi:PEP-CTERM motif-containing protein